LSIIYLPKYWFPLKIYPLRHSTDRLCQAEARARTLDANVSQRSVDFPIGHLPRHHVLLDNNLVITVNVNQVEVLH